MVYAFGFEGFGVFLVYKVFGFGFVLKVFSFCWSSLVFAFVLKFIHVPFHCLLEVLCGVLKVFLLLVFLLQVVLV